MVSRRVRSLVCTLSQIPVPLLVLFVLLSPSIGSAYANHANSKNPDPPVPMILDGKDHDMNQVLLRINNTGQIGPDLTTGNGRGFWPKDTNNNYMYGSGLWIGGKADYDGDGDLDKIFVQGYNPLAGDSEFDPGRPGQDPEDPAARIYNSNDPVDLAEWPEEFRDPVSNEPIIRSPQDFVTIYNDVSRTPVFGYSNLGIEVRQRSMAFVHELSADVIYVEWDLTNVSDRMENGPYTFEDAWIGYDTDADVGVAFADDLTSFFRDMVTPEEDTLTLDTGIVWDSDFVEANYTGTPGFMGLALIQSPGNDADGIDNDGDGLVDESSFNGIDDDGDGDIDETDEVDEIGLVNYSKHCGPSVPCQIIDPRQDDEGYELMSCISEANPDSSSPYTCLESTDPTDIKFMISSGPFDWHPGETIRVRFAFVFAAPVGDDPDLPFVGDPPRPDPNNPVLTNFITAVLEARRFARSDYSDVGIYPAVNNATNFFPVNMPFFDYPSAVSIYDTVGIARASLFYSVDSSPFEEIELIDNGNNLWSTDIPGPDFESRVDLYYEVVDSSYQVTRDPGDAPLTTYGYDVVHLPLFTNVTEEAGFSRGMSAGMAVADYDADGDPDVYRVRASENVLYRNDGNGMFTIVTDAAGLGGIGTNRAAWADYDNDGHLDLFVTDVYEQNYLFRSNGDNTFSDMADSAGVRTPENVRSFSWGDYDNDGFIDLYLSLRASGVMSQNVLYRNNGDGSFTDVAEEAGLDFALGGDWNGYWEVIWVDADDDGWLDLFLTKPLTQGSHLYRNNRDGTFLEIAGDSDISGVYSDQLMFADYDNDGDFDLIVGVDGGGIYENRGDGRFDSVGENLGLSGGVFFDTDNSGFYDIVRRVNYWHSVFYVNDGSDFLAVDGLYDAGRFVEYREPLFLDYDTDGDLDMLTLDYSDILFRNEGFPPEYAHNWLHVKCVGTASNQAGIGAKVRVTGGDQTQTRVIGGARSKVQEDLLAQFGVGDARLVDRLVVEWPSGKVQELPNVAVNRIITIIEDEDLVDIGDRGGRGPASGSIPKVFALSQNYPNPFNPSTTIQFDIPDVTGTGNLTGDRGDMPTVPVKILIYDIRGRLIEKLVDSDKKPGRYQVHWNGRDGRGQSVASGVYLYRIDAGDFSSTKKMVLVR